MIASETIDKLLTDLEQAAGVAINDKDLGQAQLLLSYHKEIKEWREAGQPDRPPVNTAELTACGLTPPADWEAPTTGQPDDGAGAGLAPEAVDSDASLRGEYTQAHQNLKDELFREAADRFDRVRRLAQAPDLKAQAETYYHEAEGRRKANLDNLAKKTAELDDNSPNDLEARRKAWRAVEQAARPEDMESERARTRLLEINRLDTAQQARRVIKTIRESLPRLQEKLDLLGTKKAVVQVRDLQKQYGDQPALAGELQELLAELEGDETRPGLLRVIKEEVGVGATEIESGRWAGAYQEFRKLLDKGVMLVYDPRTDQEKQASELYQEACEGLARFTVDKVMDRLGQADNAYQERHDPELALEYVDQALKFVTDFDAITKPGFPNILKNQVQQARDVIEDKRRPYQRQLDDYRTARQKVKKAMGLADPLQALDLLREAKAAWADYPGLDKLREEREEQLADRLAANFKRACLEVDSLVSATRFDEADKVLTKAREQTSGVTFTTPALTDAMVDLKRAHVDFQAAQQRYETYQKLLDQAHVALKRNPPDVPEAEAYLEQLTEAEKNRAEAFTLLTELSRQRSDAQNWAKAERAYQVGDYRQAEIDSQAIGEKSAYASQAAVILARSQSLRLWEQYRGQGQTPGLIGEARQAFETIRRLLETHGVDEKTRPVLDGARQELNAIGDLEQADRQVTAELDRVDNLVKAGLWAEAFERVQALVSRPTTLDKKVQTTFQKVTQGWQTYIQRRLSGLVQTDWLDFKLIATLWEELNQLEKHNLLPVQVRDEARRVEKIHLELWEPQLNARKDAAQIVDIRRRLVELSGPHEQEVRHRLHEAEVQKFLVETERKTKPDAITALEQALARDEFYGEPRLVARLIELRLELKDFSGAEESARKIRYSPFFEHDVAEQEYDFWFSLIRSTRLFAEQKYDQGQVELAQLKQDQPGRITAIDRSMQFLEGEALKQLIKQAEVSEIDDAVKAIEKYAAIIKIKKDDQRARQALERLRDRATSAVEDSRSRADSLQAGHAPLEQLIREAGVVQHQLDALLSVANHLQLSQETIRQLHEALGKLKQRSGNWSKVAASLRRAESAFETGLKRSWDFTESLNALREARQAAASEQALLGQINQLQSMIQQAANYTHNLQQQIAELKRAMQREEFEAVLQHCQELELAWREAHYFDARFEGLESRLKAYYAGEIQSELTTLSSYREKAQQQRLNLEQWQIWETEATRLMAQITGDLRQLEQPGEIDYRQRISMAQKIQTLGQGLQHHLAEGTNPTEVLSGRARAIKEQFKTQAMRQQAEQWCQKAGEIEKKCQWVEQEIRHSFEDKEKGERYNVGLISLIRQELVKRPNPVQSNVEIIRRLLDQAMDIAPDHPEVLQVTQEIEAWENRGTQKQRGGFWPFA